MNAADILRELVAIPTPSSVSNLPLLHWVKLFVEARGWTAEQYPYADESGVKKANLMARPRPSHSHDPIDLAFVCHTDTVPYAADWPDALNLRWSEGGNLHGCGACDVKGSLACFLAAVDETEASRPHPHVALILTADEEIGCKGMERLLAASDLRIGSAIVSEPTSLRFGIAGKGYGLARVTVHGIEAHSAFPGEGVSAIVLAARFISRIEALNAHIAIGEQPSFAAEALFDPPHTTVNVGTIQGGTAKNIVPAQCTFLIEWRPIPADPPRRFFEAIQHLAAEMQTGEPRGRVAVELLRAEPGFAEAGTKPLRDRLTQIAHHAQRPIRAPMGISFGSEASRLARVADEVIVIGPGDMHSAHSDRECVPLAELEEWTQTLRLLLS